MTRAAESKAHAALIGAMRFEHRTLRADETCDRAHCSTCGNGDVDSRDPHSGVVR